MYRGWAAQGLLAQCPGGNCSEVHVIDAAVLAQLFLSLPAVDARTAWSQIRAGLRDPLPFGRLDIAYDSKTKEAFIARTDGDLGMFVRTGHSIRVIALESVVDAARRGFRRVVSAGRTSAKHIDARHAGRQSLGEPPGN